ncbi:MAG: endonuclease III domain-containing protein [Candidatus Dadabacteria bacterium]|nr:endonuclease III domain-containing protein [Candidatus Dadabacteria bacterium]NIS10109.1 endonuclease III domain-containing protein [Candidatus Dadabacteria bacterium]NIY23046.1 endonuclease III domain-containing protein [Candidatus Dadabacteria bacterium]
MDTKSRINQIYDALFDHYGPQHWWPAESDLECIIGTILTQNTTWKNVEKAIDKLKQQDLISIEELGHISTEELAQIIRSSGYFNQKAIKIKNFVNFVNDNYDGDLDKFLGQDLPTLREQLLSIKGIGPETADSIILYAAKKPIFVIDAYTHRILSRHGLVPEETNYNEMQELFMDSLPDDHELFNEYHALIVKTAKEHCRKKSPVCSCCPLEFDPHTE